jgi:GAF domain-containing protein
VTSFPSPRPRPEDAERLRGLLEAHRRIGDALTLTALLDGILGVACDVVACRYGAVGVLAPDGRLEHVVHRGLDERTVQRIAAPSRSRGLLGAVLKHPRPIRLDDLTGDRRFGGLPSSHPPVAAFLGVPVRARGRTVGVLYLADPVPGRFDPADEDLVVALAATASTAIENARLYDEVRRSREWLDASGQAAQALLADAEHATLPELVTRAAQVADADNACLILPTGDGRMRVEVAVGSGADEFRGQVFDPATSVLGRAIVAAEGIRTHDMALWANLDFDNRQGFGAAMIVPLVARGDRGAVLVMRTAGRPSFTREDVDHAAAFAGQLALAMELTDARAEAENTRELAQRQRVAQALHDDVIQRLFATGVGLQALLGQLPDTDLANRLQQHIADLDDTLDRIRAKS